jgi:DNA-binding transcriptional LysR family regulator
MNFQHLKTFCTVLTEKSMTAAAQKLFLTQPAVSQQIRNLEDEMGIELLVRGVRQVKPTAQGQLLFDYAQKIISLAEQARLAIQTMGAEVSGPLRVGTLNSLGLYLIGPVFSLFLKNNSSVRLQLKYGGGSEIIELLEKGELDLAILPDAKQEYGSDPEDTDKELIFHDEMWLVTSNREKNVPKQITVKEFAEKPTIHLTKEYPGFEHFLSRELKKTGALERPVFESSNVGTLKKAVESDVGWGFLPAHSIRKQVATNRMIKVDVVDMHYRVDLFCYLPKSKVRAKATDVFLQILKR